MSTSTELDLTDIERVDCHSRQDWSRAIAVALIQTLGKQGCQLLAVRGLDEFVRVGKEQLAGHGFRYEDYRRIYDLVKIAGRRPITPKMILTHDHRTKGRTR